MTKYLKVLVHLESAFNDTIKHGSLELKISEKVIDMNQHGNRVQSAVIKHCPIGFKWIKEGDRIWFHHNITTGHRNRLSVGEGNITSNNYLVDEEKGLYLVPYGEGSEIGYECLAYLVKDGDSGEFHTINDFLFGVPNAEYTKSHTDSGIFVGTQKDKGLDIEAVIKYSNSEVDKVGIPKDKVVGLVKHANYCMEVEGETVWRFRTKDIVYTRDGDDFTPMLNWVMLKFEQPKDMTDGGIMIHESFKKFDRLGTIEKFGSTCNESSVGDEVVILKESDMYRIYDNIFITRESNLVSQNLLSGIKKWQLQA